MRKIIIEIAHSVRNMKIYLAQFNSETIAHTGIMNLLKCSELLKKEYLSQCNHM